MTRLRKIAPIVAFALAAGACGEAPSGKAADSPARNQAKAKGTGLVLDSVTGITLPLIGKLGDVVVAQAVLTNFALIEDAVGQIVGLQVDGVLQLTGGVLGTDVVTEDFTTTLSVTSSGPGQCTVVNLDLGPIAIDALVASVDIPAATVTANASGAVGSLLCALANLLSGLTTGAGAAPGAAGVVNALNNQI